MDVPLVQLKEPMNVSEIRDAIKAYIFFTGYEPITMHVTPEMEEAWKKLTVKEIGYGPDQDAADFERSTVFDSRPTRKFGIRLVWGSLHFRLAGAVK